MTKKQIANELAMRTDTTQVNANHMINVLLNIIMENLEEGKDVTFRGFGIFKAITRKKKVTHNFQTGSMMVVPPHKVVKFIPYPDLKELVR